MVPVHLLRQGTVAVLTAGSVDVLCHAAVRARNTGVLLAACRDAGVLEQLRGLHGRRVAVAADKVGEGRVGRGAAQEGECAGCTSKHCVTGQSCRVHDTARRAPIPLIKPGGAGLVWRALRFGAR